MHTQPGLKEDDNPQGFLEYRQRDERISTVVGHLYCTIYYVPTYPGRFYFDFFVVNSLNLLVKQGDM